ARRAWTLRSEEYLARAGNVSTRFATDIEWSSRKAWAFWRLGSIRCSPVTAAFDELRQRLGEITDLARTGALLGWDQQVKMPPRGAAARAEQLATLKRIAHEKFIDPEIGRLLEKLEPFEAEHDYDSLEASLIRVTRRDYEKSR